MLRHKFCFMPEVGGLIVGSITGYAEILPNKPMWSIGRIFVEPIGAGPIELPASHYLYQPIMLSLFASDVPAINALANAAAVPA